MTRESRSNFHHARIPQALGPLLIAACLAGCGVGDQPLQPGGAFAEGPPDNVTRYFHNASRLRDGRVLITGGLTIRVLPPTLIPADTIALFDPAVDRMSPGVGEPNRTLKLQVARSSHTQTTLTGDRVLVTGGNTTAVNERPGNPTKTTELIDVRHGAITFGPDMSEPRAYHSATPLSPRGVRPDLLSDSAAEAENEATDVLIAGGSTWQIFDAGEDALSDSHPLQRRRSRHAAVALTVSNTDSVTAPPRVLIIGGAESGDTMEIIDTTDETSTLLEARLPIGVFDLAAIELADGRVLIFGGQRAGSGETINQTLIFDPTSGSLEEILPPPGLVRGMGDHRMIRSGRYVFAFGGEEQVVKSDTEQRRALVFDGESLTWVNQLEMRHTHDDFPAVPLLDGRILLIGGGTGVFGLEAPTSNTEFFTPAGLD